MPSTIVLKDYTKIRKELVANAAITPGMLIERMSTDKARAHASAGQNVTPIMFALEDELQGKTIDDNYAAADRVQCGIFRAGDEVYAILRDGENVSIGDKLESNGDGNLRKHVADAHTDSSGNKEDITVYGNAIVAIALEALDLSQSSGDEGSSGAAGFNKRIKIEIV